MASALIVLAEGFEEIEALTVVDVLRRGGVNAVAASLDPSCQVRGAHGITVTADKALADVAHNEFDAVILPGGGVGTENLKASALVTEILQRQKAAGRLICAICAAPTVLVEAQVLEPNVQITCYPTCVMDIDRPSANVPVVSDGNVITAQGPGASLLFALVVLQHLTTDAIAHKIARGLVTDVL